MQSTTKADYEGGEAVQGHRGSSDREAARARIKHLVVTTLVVRLYDVKVQKYCAV